MKGLLNKIFKTDPWAREFRQRSIITPNMVMAGQNARPLEAFKEALVKRLLRGTPKGVFERGEKQFAHAQDSGRPFLESKFRNRGGPKLENACPGLPFGYVTSTPGPSRLRETRLFVPHFICVCKFWAKKARIRSDSDLILAMGQKCLSRRELSNEGNIVEETRGWPSSHCRAVALQCRDPRLAPFPLQSRFEEETSLHRGTRLSQL